MFDTASPAGHCRVLARCNIALKQPYAYVGSRFTVQMSAVFEAVRGLRLAEPTLGASKLHAKLKLQRPELHAIASEVRIAVRSLKQDAKEEAKAEKANRRRTSDALLGAWASGGGCSLLELLTAAASHRTGVEHYLDHQQQLAEAWAEVMEDQITGEEAIEIAISLGMSGPSLE